MARSRNQRRASLRSTEKDIHTASLVEAGIDDVKITQQQ